MPAQRLAQELVSIARFDVAGQDSAHDRDFIRHIGLSDESARVRANSELPLAHMGPPLSLGATTHPIQTIGRVPLSADEREQVRFYLEEVASEYLSQHALDAWRQYVIVPHYRPADARCSCRRFSCAGFVFEAYLEAGVHLVDLDRLPVCAMETLVEAYPDQVAQLQQATLRRRLGLEGDGDWRVLLPGHLLNALSRTETEMRRQPYAPVSGDEYFPPKR